MSFILDALKKSETERQRQTIPGMVESAIIRPRPRLPVWAIALCVLLGVNLIVLSAVLVRGRMTAPPEPLPGRQTPARGRQQKQVETRADEPVARNAPVATENGADPVDPPVYAPEVPLSITAPPAAGPPAAIHPSAAVAAALSAGNSGTHPVRRQDPLLAEESDKADDEVLPSVNELNLNGSQALPELHLDVHVFATRTAERFVFINMHKYHEGETLPEGPTIERIRRDGVILNYQGLRFLLPRQ